MRIARNTETIDRASMDLEIAATAHGAGVTGRVCAETCAISCPQCGSSACQCMCTPFCPQAPRALSSDPNAHPIEPAITPLVFEMKRTGMLQPCYSCEGHPDADGAMRRAPAIWFYCASPTYLRLLAAALNQLRLDGALQTSWRIGITFSDADNPDPTYVLEPDPGAATPPPSLACLQRDAHQLAFALRGAIAEQGRALQRHLAAR